jgi:hypothetical protein
VRSLAWPSRRLNKAIASSYRLPDIRRRAGHGRADPLRVAKSARAAPAKPNRCSVQTLAGASG